MDETLTVFERRVFDLRWDGMTKTDIAKKLGKGRKTIFSTLKRIEGKMGSLDTALLRERLVDKLFEKVPTMSVQETIAALRLLIPQQIEQKTETDIRMAPDGELQNLLRALFAEDAEVIGKAIQARDLR